MGYKQSPFPMQQGTSSHTSAVKQIEAETLRKLYEENPELDQRPVTGPREATAKEETKLQKKKDKKEKKENKAYEKLKKQHEKNILDSELSDAKEKGKKSRKAERKKSRHERKLSRANETVAERKKRRKENYGSLYDDLDPIWRAMDQPRSTTATGYFDDVYKEEERQAEKDKRDTARAENKTLKKQNKKFMKLINKYEKAKADNVTGKDKTE